MKKEECKHKDGWIIKDDIVIDEGKGYSNEQRYIQAECNTIGCKKIQYFDFEITNIGKNSVD